jgi:hypothetical protein
VIELAHRLLGGPDGCVRLLAREALKKSVYRLRFQLPAGRASVVVKRLSPRIGRANELVAKRWLAAVGLGRACPALRGVANERFGRKVWHIYEDVDGADVDESFDRDRLAAVIEQIVEVHTRFAGHRLLAECRKHGGELGMPFFALHVGRSIEALKSIRSLGGPVPHDQSQLRDRLLARLERLHAEQGERAPLLQSCGGPETLLHGDLWPTNTLVVGGANGFHCTLIDWDHVGVGPVSYDLSTFLYRFAPEHRPWILNRYREAAARRGWQLPDDRTLNVLFETAECARYACYLGGAALAATHDESWGFQMLAEVDTWFADLQPALPLDAGR